MGWFSAVSGEARSIAGGVAFIDGLNVRGTMSVAGVRSRVVRWRRRFVRVVVLMLDGRVAPVAVSIASLEVMDKATELVHKTWVRREVQVHKRFEHFLSLVIFGDLQANKWINVH